MNLMELEKIEQAPKEVHDYINWLEETLEIPISIVSVVTDKSKIKNLSKGIERQLGEVIVKHYNPEDSLEFSDGASSAGSASVASPEASAKAGSSGATSAEPISVPLAINSACNPSRTAV